MRVSFGRSAARALEEGRWDGALPRTLAAVWGRLAAPALVRPLEVPRGTAVVCVGGATLGGSGKTRVAIACARQLADAGARVALVGHAYRASPGAPREVSTADALEVVGDEALVCAHALAGSGARIVVGPTRQRAVDFAASLSPAPDVLVLDGPLRVRAGRHAAPGLSLLAVDAERPWGSGRPPPAGDLRAPREALLACADHVVPVDARPAHVRWPAASGEPAPLETLASRPFGLFTAIARPDRLVRALDTAGLRPAAVVSVADHGPVGGVRLPPGVGAWLATDKCALHLARLAPDAPIGILEGDVLLPEPVERALARVQEQGMGPRPPRACEKS